jgi:ribosomal-protein-alanine N-acetyltransferase
VPVRPARPSDGPLLERLQSHLEEPSPSLLDAAPALGPLLVSTAGDAAAGRETPVGYLLAVTTDDDDAYLAELVVAPTARREGRASALLTAFLDRRPPESRVTVTVAPHNAAASALYESHGFTVADRLEGFFDSGDGLRYERTV